MSGKIKIRITLALSLIGLVLYYFSLPSRLFNDPYSTVLKSNQGELLSASIAKDGQWRFPKVDTVPRKFSEALIAYEDKTVLWTSWYRSFITCPRAEAKFHGRPDCQRREYANNASHPTFQKRKTANSFPKGD